MLQQVIASIIIPVTRGTDSLRKCLKSLRQIHSERPVDIVLVGTLQDLVIVKEFNVSFVHETRLSASLRRNRGVEISRGDILCFVDDDVQVGTDWLATIIAHLSIYPDDIIGGPNRDMRNSFKYRYPTAIQENFLTEGLISHASAKKDCFQVGIHDLPLCNMAMNRKTFKRVGGFNEKIPYYLDDVEFNYIAYKAGHRLMMLKNLEVQHDIRPMIQPYFQYKFRTRFEIGKIMPLYALLYLDSFQIWLVLLSYLILPVVVTIGGGLVFSGLIACYLVLVFFSSWKYRKDLPIFWLLPAGTVLTHFLMYCGFTFGLVYGLLSYPKLHKLIPQKKERLKKINH